MTEKMTLGDALYYIQQNLNAPKNQSNTYGKYNYRSCEDILEGLKRVMPKGWFVIVHDAIELVGERYYVKATASLSDGTSGGCVAAIAYAREDESQKGMSGAQLTGSVSSYARKYALNALFAIDDNKDADSGIKNEVAKSEKIKQFKQVEAPLELAADMQPIGKDKAMELVALIKESGSNEDNVMAYASKDNEFDGIQNMPLCVFLNVQTMLIKRIDKNAKAVKALAAKLKKEAKK